MLSYRTFLIAIAAAGLLVGRATSSLGAQAYVIADAQSGAILEEHEGKQKRQVGSLTKIATAMVALDWADAHKGDLNAVATVPPEAFVGAPENNIGFQPGDTITLRDALYAALVQSDNIAAYTIANHVGESLQSIAPIAPAGNAKITPVTVFVAQMNLLAKTLHMDRTRFLNPSGQDANEKPLPYSSAIDMARLTQYALKKAGFRFYVSQKERQITWNRAGKPMHYLLRNTNELLGTNGIDGVKTGRTTRAGDCLILSAHGQSDIIKEGERTSVIPRHIIVVILGSTDRFGEGQQLLARGWGLYESWAAAGRQVDPKRAL